MDLVGDLAPHSSPRREAVLAAVAAVAVAITTVLGAASAPRSRAAGSGPLEWVGHLGGFVTVMAVQGDLAFVAAGPRLVVLDVGGDVPRYLGGTDPLSIHGPLHYLAVSEDVVFGSVARDPIQIFDVSSPAEPRLLGTFPEGYGGGAVAAVGRTLFLSQGQDVLAFDVTDPTAPGLLSTIPVYEYGRQLLVDGARLFVVTAGRGLLVLDVADPAWPRVIKWFEDIDVHMIAPFGSLALALVAEEREVPGHPELKTEVQSLRVLDLSPGAASADIGRLELEEGTAAAQDLLAIGSRAFLCLQSTVVVVDAGDPTHPTEVASLRLPWSSNMGSANPRRDFVAPGRIALAGDRLLATFNDYSPSGAHSGESGVVAFDIADPAAARDVGAWSQGAPAHVDNLAVVGDVLYLAEMPAYRMRVYDIADRRRPRQASSIEVDTLVRDFAAGGSRLVVLDGGSYAVHVLDVSDPASPKVLARRELWRATAVEMRGDLVYAAFYGPGETGSEVGQLAILRLTAAGELEELFRREGFPRVAIDLSWAGDTLVMASQTEGLTFIDVSDPFRPTVVGGIDTPYRALGATWSGEAIYVAVRLRAPEEERDLPVVPRYGGVMVVDPHDPTSPSSLGLLGVHLDDYRGNVERWGIAVSGGLALLAAAEGKVRAVDVRTPAALREVQQLPLPGVQGALAMAGEHAYVAGQDAGLSIIRVRGERAEPAHRCAFLPLALVPH